MKQLCSTVAIVVLSLLLLFLPSAMSSDPTIEAKLTAEKCASMPRWWPMSEVAKSLAMKPRILKEQPHICTEKGTKNKVPDEYLGWYAFYVPGSSPEDPKPDYGPTTLSTWAKLCSYFGTDANKDKPSEEYCKGFESYTGHEASRANIDVAFEFKLSLIAGLPRQVRFSRLKVSFAASSAALHIRQQRPVLLLS